MFLLCLYFRDSSDGNLEGYSSDVRNIQGVMRTGLFATGLMLSGEANVQLVLITANKPTTELLHSVVETLSQELPVRIPSVYTFLVKVKVIKVVYSC